VHFLLEQRARLLECQDARRAVREVGLEGAVAGTQRLVRRLEAPAAAVGAAQARVDGAEEEREEKGGGEEDRRQRGEADEEQLHLRGVDDEFGGSHGRGGADARPICHETRAGARRRRAPPRTATRSSPPSPQAVSISRWKSTTRPSETSSRTPFQAGRLGLDLGDQRARHEHRVADVAVERAHPGEDEAAVLVADHPELHLPGHRRLVAVLHHRDLGDLEGAVVDAGLLGEDLLDQRRPAEDDARVDPLAERLRFLVAFLPSVVAKISSAFAAHSCHAVRFSTG
jgi:hypothetical protein